MSKSAIRQRRIELGMSTTELAYLLGRSQSTLVRLEQSESEGRISLASLGRVAEALGCKLDYKLQRVSKRLDKILKDSL